MTPDLTGRCSIHLSYRDRYRTTPPPLMGRKVPILRITEKEGWLFVERFAGRFRHRHRKRWIEEPKERRYCRREYAIQSDLVKLLLG